MPKNQPYDDESLSSLLEELVAENELRLALDKLREVRDTFSRYDEYLEKVGLKIK